MSSDPILPIHDLFVRHRGLTPSLGSAYAEAAAVCLSRHHSPPVKVAVDAAGTITEAWINWLSPDSRVTRAWANVIDATEAGAYACALAAVEFAHGYVAIGRAETRTGADYYVAPIGADVDDLERAIRLEVSGTDRGSENDVRTRLREKSRQARNGDSNLPAMAAVVGFKTSLIVTDEVKDG